MKKSTKALSFLLTLAMMLSLVPGMSIPARAKASYTLWVGGAQVTSENAGNIDGQNKASYDADTNTLTLNGYSYSGAGYQSGYESYAIYAKQALNIVLKGENSVINNNPDNGDFTQDYGVYVTGDLSIAGPGSLSVQAQNCCISTTENITFQSGTVVVTGTGGASLYIHSVGSITINGGSVTATGTGEYGISANSLTINGGSVTASGVNKAIRSTTVTLGTGVKATAGENETNAVDVTDTFATTNTQKWARIMLPHTHNGITFNEWTDEAAKTQHNFSGATATTTLPIRGDYYLTQPVTMSGNWEPDGTLNLCLNGQTVTLSDHVTINTEATLNLYDEGEDGKIVGSSSGTGVIVGEGIFNMHGGTISGFSTGVEVSGPFNMDGGMISGNEIGVDINEGSFTMTGGTITSNMYYGVGVGADDRFNVSGAPSITNNNVDNSDARNVYLESGATITVANVLKNTTPIGVTMETPGTFTSGWSTYMNDTPPANYFTSDNGDYEVEAKDNESALTVLYPLWVGGTQVTGANAADVFGDGKVSFAPATTGENATPAILRLNGASITSYYNAGIYCTGNDDLKIILAGSNSINITDESMYGIDSQGGVTIEEMTAGACLNISVKSWGISAPKVIISSGTVNVNSESDRAINGGNIEISGGTVTAAGNSGAIFGTVKNAIAGTGWTDTEGTGDKADIAVSSEGQNLSSYKKVQFPAAHTHSFTYSASGAIITATCSADDCPLASSDYKVTLTIVKPTLTIYGQTGDGVSAEAAVTDENSIKGEATVSYYAATKDGETYTKNGNALGSAPTGAGDYVAEITLTGVKTAEGENKSVTASVDYTIAKKVPVATDFTYNAPSDLTYNGTPKTATVMAAPGISGMGAVTVKYYSDQRRFTEVTPTNVGTYYVGITLSEGNNYHDASSAIYDQDWQFTISKQAAPASLNDDQKPTAKTGLTYTGSDQALVTAPTKLPADYIEMQYAIGENATTAPTSGWGTSIPAKTNAGTYYVWYKIVGDSNHNDTEPASVTVTISKINPTYTIPTGLTATYGQRLADVALTPGWAWADSTQSVGNVGTNSFKANFTPTDTTNYSAVSNVDVAVTVDKATQTAVPSDITVHDIASDTVSLTGAAGEEYIIAPKGTTTPDWIAAVTADEYNLVTFNNDLNEATEYTVFARVAETDNYLPGTAVTKDVTTYLSSYGFGGEPLVGGTVSAPVDAQVDQAGISYQWYLDGTAIHDATGASYVVQDDDAGETLSVQPFRNGAPLWAEAYEVGEVHYATVNFYKEYKENPDELELIQSVGNLKYDDTVEAPAQPAKSGYNFAGWQEGMPGAFEVVTFPMTVEYSADVYAKWIPIYVAPAVTTVTVPVSGDVGEENVSVKISGDKAILDLITDAQIANAVGEDGKRITIDLTGMNGSYEFEISKAAGEKIADAVGEDGKALIWLKESSGGTDAFYGIEAPASVSKGSHFWVRHIEPTDATLTDAVRDYYFNNSQHEQWIIDAGMTSDGKEVHDLGGDTVNLYVAVGDDWSADDIRAVFISEDGETENVVCGPETAVNQSGEHRYARLTLNHFSTYILRNMKDCPINEFTDADANAWYHDGVHFVLENKLMSGYGNGKFGPADYTSRAMVAQILWNLEGKPASTYEISYSDVAGDAWYADAIRWATEKGVITGYGDGKFGPDDNITREQLATIIYRYAQSKGQGFTGMWMFRLDYEDAASISDWASEAMHWMVMKGIIKGQTDKTLAPKSFASRAEIATMIMRYAALEK